MHRSFLPATLVAVLWIALSAVARAAPRADGPTVVTTAIDGSPAAGGVLDAAVSANGRYVVFASSAANLVPGDTNGAWDIFVRDLERGVTERVSVDSAGAQANGNSVSPTISPDGRYVAFSSSASNLVQQDTNGVADVFLHDRRTGLTERVSLDDAGNQADGITTRPVISADGRFIAFDSFAHNLVTGTALHVGEVLLRDRRAGHTERITITTSGNQAIGGSNVAGISDDGRYVAFVSNAANLVPGPTNATQVYVRDRKAGVTERVSINSNGDQANADSFTSTPFAMSGDGRYVAFYSSANNLVPQDTNGTNDVFLHDRRSGTTTRLSVDNTGHGANDLSQWPSISADGRYVAYWSEATNLVDGDLNGAADIFVRDGKTGMTERASVGADAAEADGRSGDPTISRNGHTVVFWSSATNLTEDAVRNPELYAVDLRP